MDSPDPVAPALAVAAAPPVRGGGERQIAADLARKALIVAPVVIGVAGLLRGVDGALGAALGMAVVVGNFVLLAKAMEAGARISPQTVAAAAMGGYVALLVVVTALAVLLRELSIVDLPTFVITIAVAHLGLLFWELPRIGLTLGAPGLKPRPLSKSPEHRTRKESR